MPEVRLITPITRQSTKKMQVAAYCRVSSNSADQLNSYAAQIRAYKKYIGARDDWELVDIFADEGLTGMKSETRDEFQRMIRMCELKQIDLIITKSISRFARNTKDALAYVRKLKLLGVGVQFEKEGISTLSMGDEMLLNTFSALAQEESQSISMNQRLSISRLDYGKKYCSDSPTIMEDKLQEAIVRAVNKFNEQDNATYKALMRATISEALGLNGDPEEVDMLERKIEALNNKMLTLVNESVSSGDGIEAHESEFMTLSQEAELLKQRIAAIQESTAKDNGEQSRLEQIQAIISERESKCMEYDDSIVRQMVECIKVYPGGKLEIIFGGGYLVEESV